MLQLSCPYCRRLISAPERLRGRTVKCPSSGCGKPIPLPVALAEQPLELPEAIPGESPLELPDEPHARRWPVVPIVAGISALMIFGVSAGAILGVGIGAVAWWTKRDEGVATTRAVDAKAPPTAAGDPAPGGDLSRGKVDRSRAG
jgi:hypothetical protein